MPVSQSSTSREQQELLAALDLIRVTTTDNPFVPVDASEPQAVFLACQEREVLYGGAAGGGKSVALLASALQYVSEPGYAALLLRRTFADLSLPEALIPLSHQWLNGTGAKWDGQRHEWTFPSGATLTFGYLETEIDKYRYQGAAFQFIGFDELTQFTESQYTYLFSRLRRKGGADVPVRMRSATNPGGIGHEWVRRRFIDGRHPDRRFIPAKLEDNPFLDRDAYSEMLDRLDPVTRAQLKAGDWDIRPEGNLFKREWFDNHYTDAPPTLVRTVRAWDLAGTVPSDANPDPDYTAGVLMGQTADGEFVVLDSQEFRASPANVEKAIKRTAEADGRGVEVFIEQEPGASGKTIIDHYQRTVLPGYAVYGVRSTGDKITRAKPFSAACQNGLVWLKRGSWLNTFLDRMASFGMKGAHDDTVDAASSAHRGLTGDAEPWGQDAFTDAFDGRGESLDDPDEEEQPLSLHDRLLKRFGGTGPEEL